MGFRKSQIIRASLCDRERLLDVELNKLRNNHKEKGNRY
jgi:hypothetical protein